MILALMSILTSIFVLASESLAGECASKLLQTSDFIVTSFEPGHTFTKENGEAIEESDDHFPGLSYAVMVSTLGDGQFKRILGKNIGPFNFSTSIPKLWLKMQNVAHLREMTIQFGNRQFRNFAQFRLKSGQAQKWLTEGDWLTINFSWNPKNIIKTKFEAGMNLEKLRQNITDIEIAFKDDGTSSITLKLARIGAVKSIHDKFPNGVISIVFDDGMIGQYTHAKRILDLHRMRATSYIIIESIGNTNYLTLPQLRDMYNSGWEIGFHSYGKEFHRQSYTKFTASAIRKDFTEGIKWLKDQGLINSNNRVNFAYPHGEFKQVCLTDVVAIARDFFASSRTINSLHTETLPPADPQKLRVVYVLGENSTAEAIIERVKAAISVGDWPIVTLHTLDAKDKGTIVWAIAKFTKLIETIASEHPDIPILTVNEVLNAISDRADLR